MLEDLAHIRELTNKEAQARGELRRMSAILRRWLLEDALTGTAAPRVGKVTILAPQNNAFYRIITPENTDLFVSAGVTLFGVSIRVVMSAAQDVVVKGFDPDETVALRVDNFRKQRVVFWKGQWFTRDQVVKYVANVAQGVHAGTARDPDELLLAEARRAVAVGQNDKAAAGVTLSATPPPYDESKFQFTSAAIDLTLMELFATATCIVRSPDIAALEEYIRREITGP
jgi:hypothetical protein